MENIEKKLKEDGLLLKKIPKKHHTIEICRIAIMQNPKALQFAAKKCLDYNICLNAVEKDGDVFRYVPSRLITENMCRLAISENADLLDYVPEKFRTNEICLMAIRNDVSSLSYVSHYRRYELFNEETAIDLIEKIVDYNIEWLKYMPSSSKVVELCIKYIKKDFSISQFVPKEIKMNREILDFQKSVGKVFFLDKWYNSDERIFYVKVKVVYEQKPSIFDENKLVEEWYMGMITFENFDDFYQFLDGNLVDAELREYDFKGIDLREYNIKGAVIHNDVLSEQGLYNGDFYDIIKKHVENIKNLDIIKNEICIQMDFYYPKPIDDDEYERFDDKHVPFFYISDIHLCHRVINRFKGKATKEEIRSYIKFLARKMLDSIGTIPYNSYLLIAGDTSSEFEIAKIFYEELICFWNAKRIVVISGNHELWDPYIYLEDNIQEYRSYFNKIGITYLHNDLLYVNGRVSQRIISEEQILELKAEEIRELVQYSSVIILGGIAFSGLNYKYNAVNMRYGKSFEEVDPEVAMERDIHESNRFDIIYRKLLTAIPENKMIVLTHMKKDDWNSEPHNPNWIYLNGHNHRNYFEVGDKRVIYADNQIGYKTQNVGLKYFYIDNEYDIFAYYQDGIYEITKEQYTDFNKGKMILMSFGREDGTIYMIKKGSNYMFLIYCLYSKRSKSKYIYLLNGGKLCKLIRNQLDDLEYYYYNIEKYADNVHQLLYRYTINQQKVSKFVKKLGGYGKIHGCIVDVEKPNELDGFSYCHLFVNPTDGKVTPYFAHDVKSRIVYKDFKAMLEAHETCKLLKDNYLKLGEEAKSNLQTLQYSGDIEEWGDENSMHDEGSYLYKVSRIIKSLQYCTEKNVVRIWNEELLNYDLINSFKQVSTIEDMIDDNLVIGMEIE